MSMKSVGLLLVCAGLGSAAWAQPEPPLQGPRVREVRPPGMNERFGGDERGRAGDKAAPIRAFQRALAKLQDESTPIELRLSADQERELKAIADEHRERRAREQKPGDARSGEPRPPRGAPGDRPDGQPRPGDGPARPGAMRPDAARAAEAQVRVWSILTPAQQEFVRAEAAAIRAEMEQRRGEERMQQRLKERGAQPPAPPEAVAPAPQPPAGPAGAGRERLQRITRMLAALPPEEREQLLNRLEQELTRRLGAQGEPSGRPEGAPRPDGASRRRQGAPKPPPGMDDVQVPPPGRDPR